MGRFRVLCCQCGSDKVLEKSSRDKLGRDGDKIIWGEGIQRKCTDCSNEDFVIFKTWKE